VTPIQAVYIKPLDSHSLNEQVVPPISLTASSPCNVVCAMLISAEWRYHFELARQRISSVVLSDFLEGRNCVSILSR
jgi:hypothetical protein